MALAASTLPPSSWEIADEGRAFGKEDCCGVVHFFFFVRGEPRFLLCVTNFSKPRKQKRLTIHFFFLSFTNRELQPQLLIF